MNEKASFTVTPRYMVSRIGQWTPEVGSEAFRFINSIVPADSRDSMRNAVVQILSRGISPVCTDSQGICISTGLVVGYVQSGKTMAFEALAALAHDNGFHLIIVIAGVSNTLLGQSTSRIVRDLDVQGRRKWRVHENPGPNEAQAIKHALEAWSDPKAPPLFKRSIVITVLKHHQRLKKLTTLLERIDMSLVPTLVIDDEADQASLNAHVNRDEESTTYSRITELRSSLPHHTYLQFTATPQAPLLVNIADTLSPDFVQVLEPGEGYIGGRDFFLATPLTHVRRIPVAEIPTADEPLIGPPETLTEAVMTFLVGVANGMEDGRGNRSMLVHPSHRVAKHYDYSRWTRVMLETWRETLLLPEGDADRSDLLAGFEQSYEDLKTTAAGSLLPFRKIVGYLPYACQTRVLEVNARAGTTPEVPWDQHYSWILVGGQALDRGFTIEGLTVTYMPRGVGVGNADTLQQRGRFFGYKRDYFGICRVYLEDETIHAFRAYVEHEEDIRRQLQTTSERGESLNEWRRAFLLDLDLKPCRTSVIDQGFVRGNWAGRWFHPRRPAIASEAVLENRHTVTKFMAGLDFMADEGHSDRTEWQRHEVCPDLDLERVVTELLAQYRVSDPRDSHELTGLLLQLQHALETMGDEECAVYKMSGGRERSRGLTSDGAVKNLFQGEAPVQPKEKRGSVYPGDQAIRFDDSVSVQIHRLRLTDAVGDARLHDVPVIAVWVPPRLSAGWLSQNRES